MRIVFLGTPKFAVPCLGALEAAGHQVVGVYCPPDREAGRGRRVEPPPVKAYALSRGLPVYQPRSLRREEAQRELAALRPDALVVAAYGKILPPEVLMVPPQGCLNVHPSLLPRWRGPSPVAAALLEGDIVTGVTVMLLDEGMDTGPILAQREEPVLPEDTAASLTDRLFRLGADLLAETLERWARGEVAPQPQNEAQATYSRLIKKEDGLLDWSLPAERLGRMVRAYQPWPGAYTYWKGALLKVHEARPAPGPPETAEPGLVLVQGQRVAVVAGEGALELARVQLEGKRVVAAAELARGRPDFAGSRLGA